MRSLLAIILILLGTSACARFQTYSDVAIAERQRMNDIQARATMDAVCDIAIGAAWRELTEQERLLANLACGKPTEQEDLIRLEAMEAGSP